jgi:hypothetical protein
VVAHGILPKVVVGVRSDFFAMVRESLLLHIMSMSSGFGGHYCHMPLQRCISYV